MIKQALKKEAPAQVLVLFKLIIDAYPRLRTKPQNHPIVIISTDRCNHSTNSLDACTCYNLHIWNWKVAISSIAWMTILLLWCYLFWCLFDHNLYFTEFLTLLSFSTSIEKCYKLIVLIEGCQHCIIKASVYITKRQLL